MSDKPIYSLDQIIVQLRASHVDDKGNDVVYTKKWGGPALSYGLLQPMDADQRWFVRQAFELWDDLIAIDLNERLGDPQNAQITFGYFDQDRPGYNRHQLVPLPSGGSLFERWISDADIRISDGNINLTYGSKGVQTAIHEIGHALGLSHPGHYNGSADYEADAEYAQDTKQYTIMSYFSAGEDGGPSHSDLPSTPLLHDIAAVQAMYGADWTTRRGNDVYGYNASFSGPYREVFDFEVNTNPVVAIWDADGYDVLDASGEVLNDQLIDLMPGSFSDINGMRANVAIAFRVQIEEARGGEAGDQIFGNDAGNVLIGNGGNDSLYGGLGGDRLDGGEGDDYAGYLRAASGVTADLMFSWANAGEAAGDTYVSIENLQGSQHIDYLYGNDEANAIGGLDGDDWIYGRGGNDQLFGDADNDRLFGESGHDTLDGGSGDDTLDGGIGDDTFIVSRFGDDTIIGGDDSDTLSYERFSSAVTVNLSTGYDSFRYEDTWRLTGTINFSGVENVIGGSGNDRIYGDQFNNRLDGGAGRDTLDGGDGNDTLVVTDEYLESGYNIFDGGTGSNTLSFASFTTSLQVDLASGLHGSTMFYNMQNVTGGSGSDWIVGDAQNNRLDGGSGDVDDTLDGGLGDDTFIVGRRGTDTIIGGEGSDTLSYQRFSDDVTVDLSVGTDFWINRDFGISIGKVVFSDIDNVSGGSGNDTITGDQRDNRLYGRTGVDTLNGEGGNDTLLVTDEVNPFGRDRLDGGTGNNTLSFETFTTDVEMTLSSGLYGSTVFSNVQNVTGGGGNDTITGDEGNNRLFGGTGVDTLNGGGGDDTLLATDEVNPYGRDLLDGGTGSNTLSFETFMTDVEMTLSSGLYGSTVFTNMQNVTGGSGNDTITGDGGANRLFGGTGVDTLNGAGGDDTLLVTDEVNPYGRDVLDGGTGTNTLSFETFTTGVEMTLASGLYGSTSFTNMQNVTVGSGGDTITGDGGANRIVGRAGNDTIRGGGSNDIIFGGFASGAETTGFDGDDVIYGDAGDDVITVLWGHDEVHGGDDNDTLSFAEVTANLTLDLAAGSTSYGGGGSTLDASGNIVGSFGGWYVVTWDGIENLTGGSGGDTITGDIKDNRLDGGLGDDTAVFRGAQSAYTITRLADGRIEVRDTVAGRDGTDILTSIENLRFSDGDVAAASLAGRTIDGTAFWGGFMQGGAGVDTVSYANANYSIYVDLVREDGYARMQAGVQPIAHLSSIENITGAPNNLNYLHGDQRNNVLIGGDVFDWLNGRGGNNTLDGRGGVDYADYYEHGASVRIDLVAGRAVHATGTDTLINVEQFRGTYFDDSFNGDGNDNYFLGMHGLDTMSGNGGDDWLEGADGNDSIDGGANNDKLVGGFGDDVLTGGAGSDTFHFASSWGRDTVTDFAHGQDVLDMTGVSGLTSISQLAITSTAQGASIAFGLDSILLRGVSASSLNASDFRFTAPTIAVSGQTLIGTSGSDTLTGGTGNDRLEGRDGTDFLTGGAGADQLLGGAGTDFLYVDADDTLIDGGAGFDYAYLDSSKSYGATFKVAGTNVEYVGGTLADDVIDASGVSYGTMLFGNYGRDVLIGGAGNDRLLGSVGDDTLTGGAGNDTFYIASSGGRDTITDFTRGQDLLDVASWGSLKSMAQLAITATAQGALIAFGNESVVLQGVAAGALTASDFHFQI